MMNRKYFSGSFGFSILEMAVVLLILGIVVALFWRAIPLLRLTDDSMPVSAQLSLADKALIGFVMTNSRLPCPDTDNDGKENQSSDGACVSDEGMLPQKTLSLSAPTPLRYGVYRASNVIATKDADLATLKNRYTPLLPPPPPKGEEIEWPLDWQTSIDGITFMRVDDDAPDLQKPEDGFTGDYGFNPEDPLPPGISVLPILEGLTRNTYDLQEIAKIKNGLDFCIALRNAQSFPDNTALRAEDVNIAYAIAHPGPNSTFDAKNHSGKIFEWQGKAQTDSYDDSLQVSGFSELAVRLGCSSRLAQANGSARTAFSAYDHYRFSLAFLQFRAFVYDIKKMNLEYARLGRLMAYINISFGTISLATGTALSIIGVNDSLPLAVLTALAIATSIVQYALSIEELIGAIESVGEAEEALATASDQLIGAKIFARRARAVSNATTTRAIALRERGLLP